MISQNMENKNSSLSPGDSSQPINTSTTAIKRDHRPRYSKLSEVVRRVAPENSQCSLFCGGKKCKYESDTYWSEEHQAIKGTYSHWINDDIVAMARPSTYAMKTHGMIEQFERYGSHLLPELF